MWKRRSIPNIAPRLNRWYLCHQSLQFKKSIPWHSEDLHRTAGFHHIEYIFHQIWIYTYYEHIIYMQILNLIWLISIRGKFLLASNGIYAALQLTARAVSSGKTHGRTHLRRKRRGFDAFLGGTSLYPQKTDSAVTSMCWQHWQLDNLDRGPPPTYLEDSRRSPRHREPPAVRRLHFEEGSHSANSNVFLQLLKLHKVTI